MVKETPPSEQNFKGCTWLFTLLGKRNGQMYDYLLIHGQWTMLWLDGQGLRRKMIKKLVNKESWEEVCG